MKYLLIILILILALYAAEKKSVAVNPIIGRGVDSTTALVLTDYLSSYLHETGEYDVMERATMNAILKEQQFQKSGACDDQACMVEMGQLLGVSHLVVGTVSKLGSKYVIQTRMIDIKTGKITQFAKAEATTIEEQLDKSMRKIAYSYSEKKLEDKSIKTSDKKKSNKMLYFGIGGAALAGGGVVAYLLMRGDKEEEPTVDNTNDRFGEAPSPPQF
jgi:TolB-like protein